MRRSVVAIAAAVFLTVGCRRETGAPIPRGQPQAEKPAVDLQGGADANRLQGDWVEVHALAKEQPKGKEDYYVWTFTGDKATWRFHRTIYGKPIDAKTIASGTFKIDSNATPRKIDFEWEDAKTTPGIYDLNGDTLKLNTGGTERPTTFEDGEILVLKRQKQK